MCPSLWSVGISTITQYVTRWLLLSKFLHDSSLGHDLRLGAFLLLQDPLQVTATTTIMSTPFGPSLSIRPQAAGNLRCRCIVYNVEMSLYSIQCIPPQVISCNFSSYASKWKNSPFSADPILLSITWCYHYLMLSLSDVSDAIILL